jgi:hypothetical protein
MRSAWCSLQSFVLIGCLFSVFSVDHVHGLSGGSSITIDDVNLEIPVGKEVATVNITNLTCFKLAVEDIFLQWDANVNETAAIDAKIKVGSFSTECTFAYEYRADFLNVIGGGNAKLISSNNTAQVDATLRNLGDANESVLVQSCDSTLNIDSVEFLTPEPYSFMFDSLFAGGGEPNGNATKDLLSAGLCGFLKDSKNIAGLLGRGKSISTMLSSIVSGDPLSKEKLLKNSSSLVDFRNPVSVQSIGVVLGLHVLGSYLGQIETGGSDLNINVALRGLILAKDNASLSLNLTGYDLKFNGTSGAEVSSLTLDTLKITGLDRFTKFEDLKILGRHTLQADFAIISLDIVLAGNIRVGRNETELVVLPASVQDVDMSVAILLAIDEALLGMTPSGALLDMDVLSSCLLSSLSNLQITDSSVRSLRLILPTPENLLPITDAGIEFNIQKVLQNIFNTRTKNTQGKSANSCVVPDFSNPNSPYIDFRDFLLEPDDSLAYGGSNLAPYGRVPSSFMTFLSNSWFSLDSTNNEPRINAKFLAPFTEELSGQKGRISINTPFTLFDSTYYGSKVVSFAGAAFKSIFIEQLDSIQYPIRFLEPVAKNGATITNNVSIAPLRLGGIANIKLGAEGKYSLASLLRIPMSCSSQLLMVLYTFRCFKYHG